MMNIKPEFYPYFIGGLIVILAVFFGFKMIPFETFWAIVAALLGLEGITAHASSRKQLNGLGRAQGRKE